jgi:hypothetical protein
VVVGSPWTSYKLRLLMLLGYLIIWGVQLLSSLWCTHRRRIEKGRRFTLWIGD